MDTSNFNLIDNFIASRRLSVVKKYIDHKDDILDFGCGCQGYLLRSISYKINSGVGLDFEVENIVNGNLSFKKFIFKNKLPFGNNSFDKIVLLAVLEHIDLKLVNKLFNEFSRVLKKGGLVILTTPTPRSKWLLEFLSIKLGLISKDQILDHKKYYSRNDLVKLSKTSGFKKHDYKLFQFGFNSLVVFVKR